MAITSENNSGMVMPVSPMYGGGNGGFGGGFGGDWGWIILLLLCGWGNGGFGGFGGGFGNMMLGYDFPWLLNGQNGINNNVSDGFRTAQLQDSITSVRDGISNLSTQLCGCCGDMQMSLANGFAGVQQSLCNGFAGTTAAVTAAQNGITQQLYSNELASLNRSFAEQTANMQGFNSVNAGLADAKYVEATEACATRTASAQNTRDIIDAQTRGTQAILDKLCALELDGYKREAADLRQRLNMSELAASQTAQTAQILANNNAQTALFQQGLNDEVDALYNRLNNCQVATVPVYGRQPIFSCNNNNGCGCSGNTGFVA